MPGKYWKPQEEQLLRHLWESGVHDFKILAEKIGRNPLGVQRKVERMSLGGGRKKSARKPTTSAAITLGKDLFTHEKVLKVLVGAIEKAGEPGLDKLEIMRLKVLVDAAKTYDSVLEKFERWVEFEAQLSEMAEEIAEIKKELKKAKDNA